MDRPLLTYPGSLHYYIGDLLARLGDYGDLAWAGTSAFLVSLLVALSFVNFLPPAYSSRRTVKYLRSPLVFSLAITATILLPRLPNLILFEQNPDESLWLAGAATLLQDPRFWISVNGGTSGPLIILPLTVIKIFGGTINYATVRLFGLVFCLIPSVLLVYRAFLNLFGDRIARVLVLPLTVCVALANFWDIIAYNGEHVPMLLTSLAAFSFSKIVTVPGKRVPYLSLMGFAVGCMPYAKLQAVPIAVAAGLFCCAKMISDNKGDLKRLIREAAFFIAAVLLPTLIVIAYAALFNVIHDFWRSYIVFNFTYAKTGLSDSMFSWREKTWIMYYYILLLTDTKFYFVALVLGSIAAAVILREAGKYVSSAHRQAIFFSLLVLAAAVYGVMQPGNFFTHYQVLLLVPAALLCGAMIGSVPAAYAQAGISAGRRLKMYMALFVVFSVVVPAGFALLRGNSGVKFARKYGSAVIKSKVVDKIKEYARPNEKMAIWGWMDGYYALTGLLQGTRDPHFILIKKTHQQDYFLRNYVEDITRNRPVIFLDAVAPQSFYFQEPQERYENFPVVKAVVDRDYTLAAEINNMRIFVRNDRYGQRSKEKLRGTARRAE